MRTFLRFLALAFLLGIGTVSDAQARGPGGWLWGRFRSPDRNVIRVAGQDYIVTAGLVYDVNYFTPIALPGSTPVSSTLRAVVSISMADGRAFNGQITPTRVTMVMAGRAYWTSQLSPLVYLWRIALPPFGYGQFHAGGMPSVGEGLAMVARIEIRTARGTTIVTRPVIAPRAPIGIELTPGV